MTTGLASGASAQDLVPGDPDALDRLAARLSVFADGMSDAATTLADVEAAGWTGAASNAFSALVGEQPEQYRTAGSSFGEAVSAIRGYAAVLRSAQADAARAAAQAADAARESERWRGQRAAHDAEVRTARAGGEDPPDGPAPPASDPGASDLAAAQRLLGDARAQVRAQGRAAAAALNAAADRAPDEPGLFDKVIGGIGEFFGGVWEGVQGIADTVVMIAKLSPLRALIDPEGWRRDATNLAKGLIWAATHPVAFLKVMTDWETWKTNPLRAFGRLIPDIAIAIASGGTSTAATAGSRGMRGLRVLARGVRRADPGDWRRADFGDWASGGRGLRVDTPYRDIARNERWASDAYDHIRATDGDIDAIARHVEQRGFSRADVADIKDHVFQREHQLDFDGPGSPPRRFDADPDMAEAWLRLRAGRGLDEDIVLLNHELAELRYMREHGAPYREGHDYANGRGHDWENRIPDGTPNEDFDADW